MSLTLLETQKLEDAGLTEFLRNNWERYLRLARNTYLFLVCNFPESGEGRREVHCDDVALVLTLLLEVDPSLNYYLGANTGRQKYWHRYFVDLILDNCWVELIKLKPKLVETEPELVGQT